MNNIRQSSLWAAYLEKLGWQVDKIDGNFIYIKKFPLIGAFIKIQRVKNFDLKKIESVRKKYRAFSIKIEPDFSAPKSFINSLQKLGFKKDNFPLSPPKTIWVNLEKDEGELLSKMNSKTRYNIRLAQKKGVTIVKTKDVRLFAQYWNRNHRILSFFVNKELEVFGKDFIPKNAFILLACRNDKILAGVLIAIWQKQAYYAYAFSTHEGKKLFAPTLLIWRSILELKKQGIKILDFEGIYDERYHSATKSWQGFSRFKKSFGGKEVEYPETFSKCYFPRFW